MALHLTVVTMGGDEVTSVEIDPASTLENLRQQIDVQLAAQSPSRFLTTLLHGSQKVQGSATVAESGLVSGDRLSLVKVALPRISFEEGPHGWSNVAGEDGPPLEEGQLAALLTSVCKGPSTGTEKPPGHIHPFVVTEGDVTRQFLKSAKPYKIHFCRSPDVDSAVLTKEIEAHNIACVHRKTGRRPGSNGAVVDMQISHVPRGENFSTLVLFEGGFPHGGESYADVHAPWGTCFTDIPPGGSLIIEIPW